jgi:hypothetical protein
VRKLIVGLTVLPLLSGCNVILKEVRYPGGYPGHILDERTFDARANKRLQLLRGAMVLAVAARVGEASVRAEDGDGFAKLLSNAAGEINHAAANLGMADAVTCSIRTPAPPPVPPVAPPAPAPVAPVPNGADAACDGYYVNYEADVARIEARVTRAIIAALPTDRAREFLNKLAKGDMLSAAWSAFGASADMAGAFHRGAGVYRSGMETVAAGMTTHCPGKDLEKTMTVVDAATCLGLDPDNLFDKDDAPASAFTDEIRPEAFNAVMRIVRTSCVALPLSNELKPDDLEKSRTTRREACASLAFAPQRRFDQVPR